MFDVGPLVAAVFIGEENNFFAGMEPVIVAELVHKFVEHGVRNFVRFDEKLVDDAVHRFGVFCGEVVEAFLSVSTPATPP